MTTALAPTETRNRKSTSDAVETDGSPPTQVVSFRLANEEYGLNIMAVQEIILMGEITEIPEVPAYIRGLINLRGKVIPIVDLRNRFKLETGQPNEHTRIVVVNSNGHTFGIVVDAVNEVLRLEKGQIEAPPKGVTGLDSAYIKGLVKMKEKIMILLEIDRILSQDDKSVMSAVGGASS